MFRYNQTPSGSFIGGAAQPVRLREAVKHGLLFFLRNTDSGIAYGKEEIKAVVGFLFPKAGRVDIVSRSTSTTTSLCSVNSIAFFKRLCSS